MAFMFINMLAASQSKKTVKLYRPVLLVGSGALCARYDTALRQLSGRGAAATIDNPAPAGLFRLACDAGLLTPEPGNSDD